MAVSGGADSVALLHLFHRLAGDFPLFLTVAHLDHGMREESLHDADFVRALCGDLQLPLVSSRIDVPALARLRSRGAEEAAREARREFLLRIAADQDCQVIALGHHRNDQAETVLHRLLRGTGLSGLAAMQWCNGPFIRPFLDFSRDQIQHYLAAEGLSWVEDASNRDPAYTRNRIRHEVLPLLCQFNPRVEEHLARLSRRVAEEEDFWRIEVEQALEQVSRQGHAGPVLERQALLQLHPALRARVLRHVLLLVRGDLLGIAASHLGAVEQLLQAERPQAARDLPGVWVARRYDQLVFRTEPPAEPEPFEIVVHGPGRYRLPGGGCLEVGLCAAPSGEGAFAVEFDSGKVSFPLRIRSPQPGDRIRLGGMVGRKRLKKLFIEERMDHEARRRAVLVEADEIIWAVGLRRCAERRPAGPRCRVLRLVFNNPES